MSKMKTVPITEERLKERQKRKPNREIEKVFLREVGMIGLGNLYGQVTKLHLIHSSSSL